MTIQELQRRQSWDLDQKIDHAVATIENFIATTGQKIYVSFSGGKDSTILLFIARHFVDKDIPAVFCNTGNEYPEIVQFVKTIENVTVIHPDMTIRQIIEKYGFPLVSKDVSLKVRQLRHSHSQKLIDIRLHGYPDRQRTMAKCPMKWQYLRDVPFDISEKCCDFIKKNSFKRYEKEHDCLPLIGVTAAESRLRTMQYIVRGGCNAFNAPRPRSFPISIFLEKDIYEMADRFNIKLAKIYDSRQVRQAGCMVCGYGADQDPRHFDYLYSHWPKVYDYFMRLTNNGVTYREALHTIGVKLPDER